MSLLLFIDFNIIENVWLVDSIPHICANTTIINWNIVSFIYRISTLPLIRFWNTSLTFLFYAFNCLLSNPPPFYSRMLVCVCFTHESSNFECFGLGIAWKFFIRLWWCGRIRCRFVGWGAMRVLICSWKNKIIWSIDRYLSLYWKRAKHFPYTV